MPQEKKKKKKLNRRARPRGTKRETQVARELAAIKKGREQIKAQKRKDAIQSIKKWKQGVRRNEMPGSLHNPRVDSSGNKPVYPPPKPLRRKQK